MDLTMIIIFSEELAEEFKRQFTCLGENTQKIQNLYSSNRKKVTRINKDGEELTKDMSYILQFIDSARFIASSLSNTVNNRFEGINRIKYKYGHDEKNVKHVELNISIATVFWNTQILKMI